MIQSTKNIYIGNIVKKDNIGGVGNLDNIAVQTPCGQGV